MIPNFWGTDPSTQPTPPTMSYPDGQGGYTQLPTNPLGQTPNVPLIGQGPDYTSPSDWGGLGQTMGYFPWSGQNPQGSAGVGGQGGTLDPGGIGVGGPLPGSTTGLGSFGSGDLGSFGNTAGLHTGGFRNYYQGLGYNNLNSYMQGVGLPQTGSNFGSQPGTTGSPNRNIVSK